MELTKEQIAFIKQDIQARGITMDGLADSLADHICCTIENDFETDFIKAYTKALDAFGENGIQKTQQNTTLLLKLKKEMIMKGTMYLLGYLATILCSTSVLFKILQWQGAPQLLILGVIILNLGFLPMYFYYRYKKAIA